MFLTARKIGPEAQTLTTPRVVAIEAGDIQYLKSKLNSTTKASEGTVVKTKLGGSGSALEFWVAETPSQIEVAKNPLSSNVYAQDKALGLSGTGTTQGAGTSITKYLSEFTTIGAGATEAATLDAATVGKTRVVLNNDAAGDAVKLFPAVGEFIGAGAANAVHSIAGSAKVHLYCEVAGTWKIATE